MPEYQLKNGQTATDPRLGRVPSADPGREKYPLSAALPVTAMPTVKRLWGHPLTWLDQGNEGSCTGFAAANDIAALPAEHLTVSNAYGRAIYEWNKDHDEWPGDNYEGSSVNAAMNCLRSHGFIDEFRWAASIEEVCSAIVNIGPVNFGINWFNGMFYPDNKYLIRPTGGVAGGHSLMGRGFYPANTDIGLPEGQGTVRFSLPVIRLENSWGKGWGINGDAFIYTDDMKNLLANGGECAVARGRHVLNPLPAI